MSVIFNMVGKIHFLYIFRSLKPNICGCLVEEIVGYDANAYKRINNCSLNILGGGKAVLKLIAQSFRADTP
jgi:hypothetical protein